MNFGGGVSDPTVETAALQSFSESSLSESEAAAGKPLDSREARETSSPLDDLLPIPEVKQKG